MNDIESMEIEQMRGIMLVFIATSSIACADRGADEAASTTTEDSAFAALQERGASPGAMGVDQYASAHRFDDLADGGRIELQDTVGDDAAVTQIRSHMQHIAQAFAQGNFAIPGFVHDTGEVPGTRVMTEKRSAIRYTYGELPRGGELRITTEDADAVRAVHEFLAFQRMDHRAMGHSAH